MRNHQAEEVLKKDMLDLMLVYKASLVEKGAVLDGVIEFLEKTSTFIELFRDRRPINVMEDNRLNDLNSICDWFFTKTSSHCNAMKILRHVGKGSLNYGR